MADILQRIDLNGSVKIVHHSEGNEEASVVDHHPPTECHPDSEESDVDVDGLGMFLQKTGFVLSLFFREGEKQNKTKLNLCKEINY